MELSTRKLLFLLVATFGLFLIVFVVHSQNSTEVTFDNFRPISVLTRERPPRPLDAYSEIVVEELNRNTSVDEIELIDSVNTSLPVPDPILVNEPSPRQLPLSNFATSLSTFDWTSFNEALEKKNVQRVETFQEDLMDRLIPFVILEPIVPINTSCLPPPLTDLPDCSGHGSAFSGSRRSDPLPKIGILIQFGFDVDVLEVYLNEVYDVVDYFFIIESTRAHFRSLKKFLMWEHVKGQGRFKKFQDKIVHFVLDDAEAAEATAVHEKSKKIVDTNVIWTMEGLQERLRWTKFLKWNDAHQFFQVNDLIGFGDADEVPSRTMIHAMKHCDLKGSRVDFGIWFPFGRIHQAFRSDFPVQGHPYTLGDPTFWTLEAAKEFSSKSNNSVPGRMRGKSNHFILGGMHMTHYGYMPFLLVRLLSCTECSPTEVQLVKKSEDFSKGQIRDFELKLGSVSSSVLKRIVNVTTISKELIEIAILPWFYDCNRDRYPVWEGGHDTRLD